VVQESDVRRRPPDPVGLGHRFPKRACRARTGPSSFRMGRPRFQGRFTSPSSTLRTTATHREPDRARTTEGATRFARRRSHTREDASRFPRHRSRNREHARRFRGRRTHTREGATRVPRRRTLTPDGPTRRALLAPRSRTNKVAILGYQSCPTRTMSYGAAEFRMRFRCWVRVTLQLSVSELAIGSERLHE
jgi:hypothetical protein